MSTVAVEFVRSVLREAEHGRRVLVLEPVARRRHYPLLFAVLGLEVHVTKDVWRVHRCRGVHVHTTLDSHLGDASTSTEGYLVLPDWSSNSVGLAMSAAHQGGMAVKGVIVASGTEPLPAELQELLEAPGCPVDSLEFVPSASPEAAAVGGQKVTVEATLSSIFVLAGQSNMSGRGEIDQNMSRTRVTESHSSSHLYYDPVLGWTALAPALSILHKHVDLLKDCGIGIGNYFANDFARLQQEGEHIVGLIPVAVGATALHEWMPDFPNEGFLQQQAYHPGGPNLFSCALRSIYLALKQSRGVSGDFQKSPSISGVLWYQGENDCTLGSEAALSYGARFELFLGELRLAVEVLEMIATGSFWQERTKCVLPVVTTAITSTRGALLEHLCIVREQQLCLGSSSGKVLEKVAVVDAVGCGLKVDCIHLTSHSLALLSAEMARQMVALLRDQVQPGKSPQALVSPDVPVGSASFLDADAESADDVGYAAEFVRARLSAIASAQQHLQAQASSGEASGAAMRQSGLRAVNFVRGEVYFLDFLRVLRLAAPFMTSARDAEFVDLGCGVGSCLAAASCLSRPTFTRLCGLDLSRTKTLECSLLLSELRVAQSVQVLEGNFLSPQVDWWREASVVYLCATCFAQDVWVSLCSLLALVQPDCIIMCVDKELPAVDWQLLASVQVNSTWGLANVRVYRLQG